MEIEEKLKIRALAYENTTQPKSIMVEAFGNENQKNRFQKDNGWKDKRREEPFLRTLNQYFESVESVKVKGVRAKQYKLGAARDEVAERESRNETNGKYKNSTRHLDALILAHLESNIENYKEIEKSLIDWMYEFKMINDASYRLYKSKFNQQFNRETWRLIQNAVDTTDVNVIDASYKFLRQDISNQRGVLLSSLKRMADNDIIETFDRPKALLARGIKNSEGEVIRVVDVDTATYKMFLNKKRELREKYNLEERQIAESQFEDDSVQKNVRAYRKELNTFLKEGIRIKDTYGDEIGSPIINIWNDLAIFVKASKKKTMDYLNKFHAQVLKDYIEYKEEKYLALQAQGYKTNRKEERLSKAAKKKDAHIAHQMKRDKEEQEKIVFGRSRYKENHFENQARLSKEEFMKAIEKLDEVFGDKFVIDEERIKQIS